MNQMGIEIHMAVETTIDVKKFNEKFIEWVESNGWVCGGVMYPVDENGNKIEK